MILTAKTGVHKIMDISAHTSSNMENITCLAKNDLTQKYKYISR